MLFGFVVAVIVGFLYTAGRNWTGLWTPRGNALAGIAALWIAGRAAMLFAHPLLAGIAGPMPPNPAPLDLSQARAASAT